FNRFDKPGDLIEIFRNVYEHWAVYVGDGYVVHLLGPDGNFSSFSTINLPVGKNNILKQKLLEVVSSDEWHINNNMDQEKQPRPAHVIVEQANKLVGTTRSYNVVDYNLANRSLNVSSAFSLTCCCLPLYP
uniref:LRAT domain-containing protein n=1 Tax=Xiphophorus couchianus TaxID=32473 RepID=A0A3B5LQM9_9TELE